jgi:phage terminase Nu1 subunit (DNA packaging protein)
MTTADIKILEETQKDLDLLKESDFETYDHLLRRMIDFIKEEIKKEEGVK